MSLLSLGSANPIRVVYVLAFGGAGLVCFGLLPRARRIGDADTRRGLVALLATSGAWAFATVGFLLVPTPALKLAFHQFGLIVGLSTVGPWLYFCSAYTGRSLHRVTAFRRLAVAVFLAIVAVKVTNPVHGLYFRTEFLATPFPHLAVRLQLLHWVVMGVAYALAAVGYFMLFELFWQVDHDTRPFFVLVGLTGLPVVLDVAGMASPQLVDMTYEPLGVAAFAAGVLLVYYDDFRTIQLTGTYDDAVIVLDDEDRVRDFNAEAGELFPDLAVDEPIDALVPELTDFRETPDTVMRIERVGGMRYYQLSSNPFTTDATRRGQLLTLTDITDREQYRAELERQNERLEQFASMVSHDLRNPLNVAQARLTLAREEHASENLDIAVTALERMETLVDDVLTLARQGQPIDETEQVSLSAAVSRSWGVVDTAEATLSVESDVAFVADPDRLQQLLENLFRNAIEHGRDDVTVRVGALPDAAGFYIEDDGPGIPAEDREDVFESGYSTADDGTGFGLAIVSEIAEAHDWRIRATEGTEGGARFEITGVDVDTHVEVERSSR